LDGQWDKEEKIGLIQRLHAPIFGIIY